MPTRLREFIQTELRRAREAEATGEFSHAWHCLERAHIVSQAQAWPHVRVHLAMITFAWRRRDFHEWAGQVPRLLLAAPGSWLSRAPLGNTGRANVGIFTRVPIPEELQAVLRESAGLHRAQQASLDARGSARP
jgi:hypothetical protein